MSLNGCYYFPNLTARTYLALVETEAKVEIVGGGHRTTLRQIYAGPQEEQMVEYALPKVAITEVSFIVGDRQVKSAIRGVDADATSSVPACMIGSVPPHENVLVTISYIGQLADIPGTANLSSDSSSRVMYRYYIPRYLLATTLSFTAEITGHVHCITSPCAITSTIQDDCARASVATSTLDTDLEVFIETDVSCLLEIQRSGSALMATIPPEKHMLERIPPDILVIVDIKSNKYYPRLRAALQTTFLKSLSVDTRFNIINCGECVFQSLRSYSTETCGEASTALRGVSNGGWFRSDCSLVQKLETAIVDKNVYNNLALLVITDSPHPEIPRMLNRRAVPGIRVFPLGLDCSVDDIARAGRGRSFSAKDMDEVHVDMDEVLVDMLRTAMEPQCTYTLELVFPDRTIDPNSEISPQRALGKQKMKVSELGRPIPVQPPAYLQTPTRVTGSSSPQNVFVLLPSSEIPTSLRLTRRYITPGKEWPTTTEMPIKIVHSDVLVPLAVYKEMQELDDGRGWITRLTSAGPVNSGLAGKENRRLGETYGVAGKYASLVMMERKPRGEGYVLVDPEDEYEFVELDDRSVVSVATEYTTDDPAPVVACSASAAQPRYRPSRLRLGCERIESTPERNQDVPWGTEAMDMYGYGPYNPIPTTPESKKSSSIESLKRAMSRTKFSPALFSIPKRPQKRASSVSLRDSPAVATTKTSSSPVSKTTEASTLGGNSEVTLAVPALAGAGKSGGDSPSVSTTKSCSSPVSTTTELSSLKGISEVTPTLPALSQSALLPLRDIDPTLSVYEILPLLRRDLLAKKFLGCHTYSALIQPVNDDLRKLFVLVHAEGYWSWTDEGEFERIISVTESEARKLFGYNIGADEMATLCALTFLQHQLADVRRWELLGVKVENWLVSRGVDLHRKSVICHLYE